MSGRFKNVLKLAFVYLLILFSGCEVEKDFTEQSKIIAKRFSMKEAVGKSNFKLNQAMDKIRGINSNNNNLDITNSKLVLDDKSGLFFDDEKGIYIQKDNLKSYTFPIIRTSPSEKIKNICFNEKENGNYDVYLVKYDFTMQQALTLTEEQKAASQKQFITLMKDGVKQDEFKLQCIDIYVTTTTEYVVPIDEGNLTGNFGNTTVSHSTSVLIGSFCSMQGLSGGNQGGGNLSGNSGGSGSSGTGQNPDTGTTGDIITGLNTETIGNGLNDEEIFFYNYQAFTQMMNNDQKKIFENHPEFINYLIANNWSANSTDLVNELISLIGYNPNNYQSMEPFIIEKQIDGDQLDPCSKAVFQQIKNTTNHIFAKVLTKFEANNSTYQLKIKTEYNNDVNGNPVVDPANTRRTTQGLKYNYTIFINPDYQNKTKLYIATLLLHELAHAYFFSLLDDYNSGIDNSFNELPVLYNAFVIRKQSFNPSITHEEIANSYVSAISRALEDYLPGLSQQVYDDMAWSGLEGTDIFNTIHPLGSDSRIRIENRKAAEQLGHSIGEGTPQAQIPFGQPCN